MKPRRNIDLDRRAEIGVERRNRTREKLIGAAQIVIAERGVDRSVIDDYIAAAGVSRGTFYNYYKTKEELLADLGERLKESRRRDEDRVRRYTTDPAERLVANVRMHIVRAKQDKNFSESLVDDRFEESFQSALREGPRKDIRAAIKARRLRITDVEFATDIVFGIVHRGMRRALARNAPENLDILIATSILAALGMNYDEAIEVANRSLPA